MVFVLLGIHWRTRGDDVQQLGTTIMSSGPDDGGLWLGRVTWSKEVSHQQDIIGELWENARCIPTLAVNGEDVFHLGLA
jgi:hypothetical protein